MRFANLSTLMTFHKFLMVKNEISVVENPYLEPKNISLGHLEVKIEVFREILSQFADQAPERSAILTHHVSDSSFTHVLLVYVS